MRYAHSPKQEADMSETGTNLFNHIQAWFAGQLGLT